MNYERELNRFENYLNTRVSMGGLSTGTVRVYMYALRQWFSSINGAGVSRETAQRYIDRLAGLKSASTVGLKAHAIMRYFKWKGTIIDLECPTIRPPEPNYLTMDQFDEVLLACRTSLETVLVIVLFDTAVRISELLNIELDDINWEDKLITVVRKGGRKEEVNITDKGLVALEKWISVRESRSKRVFMDLTYNDAWVVVKGIGKRAGIPIHPHIFRHTRAIQMLRLGTDLHIVQQHLGHRKLSTTADLYGRFIAVHLKEFVPAW